jgi:hypothetical protein
LCGDNLVPNALDSWLGEKGAGHLPYAGKRSRFAALTVGLFDLFREKHPSGGVFVVGLPGRRVPSRPGLRSI